MAEDAVEPAPPQGSATGSVEQTDPRWRPSPTKVVAGLVLLAGIVLPLLVGTYASVEPRILGFPFFYAYQLIWVFLAAGCCAIAFLLLRAEQRRFEARSRDGGTAGTPGQDASEEHR
ncbi:hypothetical protein FHX74_003225 [Friedmanniella endophytica]|uniref:Uncharacterized protein n=1 Tax=Microlunatus kandeliicorticis TaxID=1759536 RepID=A0A7W3IUN0_9ACTN|nr:DUF3311 domain-containing protein [Microlunatus kandeliicorticis]MBA8795589.1 hypothetical protein [Microlunatus kandeliicorticis]